MADLRHRIRDIQRHVGVEADGIFGPISAAATLQALRAGAGMDDGELIEAELDARTLRNIRTLDEGVQDRFTRFSRLAKATAAAMGCDYVMISGYRSWDEQNRLFDKGRTAPGPRVTNARAGQSWHNFGLAADYGVLRGSHYLDADNPTLARRVHVACSAHAEECGLAWGGDWKRFQDIPHYQLGDVPGSPSSEHRGLYKEKGSVL